MNEKYKKYLPIGSVVILKGGTKRVMIVGYCSIANQDKTNLFDYSAVLYPEGYLKADQICLFNHEQIEKIFCLGFSDDEDKKFREELIKLEPQIKESLKNQTIKQGDSKDFLSN